jgi:RNA polymerase sigma-70 factor (ECF subfamily)
VLDGISPPSIAAGPADGPSRLAPGRLSKGSPDHVGGSIRRVDENLGVSVTDRQSEGTSSPVDRPGLDGAHELLVRSRSELAALDSLYHSLAPGLLRWIRARVADPEVATDLLAETFAQVVCSVERYRGEGDESAVAWVWGIARNLLRRYYRRQRVETAARQRLGVTAPEPVTIGPDEAHAAFVGEELRAALDGLPVRTRESVWLRVVDDLPYEVIATRQGCSTTAVRQRVSRGMRQLATTMGGTT